MASGLALSASRTITTKRQQLSTRRTALHVVAQAQSMRAPEVQQASARDVATQAAFAQQAAAQHQWWEQLARVFPAARPTTPEDDEWRQLFGQYLDEAEEAHAKHGMFVSHLAERMALEAPTRNSKHM